MVAVCCTANFLFQIADKVSSVRLQEEYIKVVTNWALVMQHRIRQALDDLASLSQTMSGSEREQVLKTIEHFRHFAEEDDYIITLYEKLFSKTSDHPPKK